MSSLTRLWRLAKSPRVREAMRARALWNDQAAQLRAQFAELARQRAARRGVHWLPLEWSGQVVFARDRQTGLLTAMAGCVIRFEAEDLLEENENASIPRDATALFHFQDGVWGTGGKALFNLNPELALVRLGDQFAAVDDCD